MVFTKESSIEQSLNSKSLNNVQSYTFNIVII